MKSRGKWALAVLSTAGALLACEVAFRFRARAQDRQTLTEALARADRSIAPGAVVSLGQMIELSPHDRVVYELRPDLDVVFNGHRVTTNAAGFRNAEVALEKPPGSRRIVGIGDSFLFGWSLPDDSDYLSVTRRLLAERQAEPRWETINTAAPGYNTVNEVAVLEAKGLAYDPDVVVLGLVGNDLDLPNFLQSKRDYLALDRSFLLDALRGGSGHAPALHAAPQADGARGHFERDPERVPPEYRHLVGWTPFESALERLAELARTEGFTVAVVYLSPKRRTEMTDALARCRELGFVVVDLGPAFDAFLAERGQKRVRGSELAISADDAHPSALAHEMAAKALIAALEEAGVLAP